VDAREEEEAMGEFEGDIGRELRLGYVMGAITERGGCSVGVGGTGVHK